VAAEDFAIGQGEGGGEGEVVICCGEDFCGVGVEGDFEEVGAGDGIPELLIGGGGGEIESEAGEARAAVMGEEELVFMDIEVDEADGFAGVIELVGEFEASLEGGERRVGGSGGGVGGGR